MMRLTLINPPSPAGATINREGAAGFGNRYASAGAFLYPPQTLATCAAVLRQAGHAPALLDATAEQWSVETTLERVAAGNPQAAVALLSWAGWPEDIAFCRALRAAQPALPLIVIGSVLRQPEYVAQAAAISDLALIGEPERALPAAIEAARRQDGPGRSAPAQSLAPADYDADGYLTDLESLPLPAWDLAPVGRYRMLTLLSSRGCPQRCTYCPYVIGWGPRFRAASPARVVAELAWLAETFRPARLMFRDPVFAHDRARVVGMCEAIAARRLRLSWECESRPEHFDPELLRLMRDAGCATVKIGLESGAPQRLVQVGRVPDIEAARAYLQRTAEVVAACRRIGLRAHIFVMVGWPGADAAEEQTTEDFVRRLRPEHLTVKAVEAYPGTAWTRAGAPADAAAAARQSARLRALASGRPRPAWRQVWGRLRRMLR
jgi:anaerobic magnesium-protoporphyrin IX monomethyl ester cyclase